MDGFDLSKIFRIYVGSTQYSAIYKGNNLIWKDTSNPYYGWPVLPFTKIDDAQTDENIRPGISSLDDPSPTLVYLVRANIAALGKTFYLKGHSTYDKADKLSYFDDGWEFENYTKNDYIVENSMRPWEKKIYYNRDDRNYYRYDNSTESRLVSLGTTDPTISPTI